MAMTLYSPHSGHPVKVRDVDVGRAIRDEQGRIFYVVERSDGSGYYAALTRHGSEKDEARYDDLAARIASGEFVPEPIESEAASGAAQAGGAPKPHDATGRRKVSPLRVALVVLILLIVLAAAAVALEWSMEVGTLPSGESPATAVALVMMHLAGGSALHVDVGMAVVAGVGGPAMAGLVVGGVAGLG